MKTMLNALAIVSLSFFSAAAKDLTLLNASYDPTRELYQDFNAAFAKFWEAKTGDKVTIRQSHSGSGKQARAVIDGPIRCQTKGDTLTARFRSCSSATTSTTGSGRN